LAEIADCQAQAGDIAGAKQTSADAEKIKPQSLPSNDEARGWERFHSATEEHGDADWALALADIGDFAGAKQSFSISGNSDQDWHLAYIAEKQAEAGHLADAQQTYSELSPRLSHDEKDDFSASLACGEARLGDVTAAGKIASGIENGSGRHKALECIEEHLNPVGAWTQLLRKLQFTAVNGVAAGYRDNQFAASVAEAQGDPKNLRLAVDSLAYGLREVKRKSAEQQR
jgi:hypothetical protein